MASGFPGLGVGDATMPAPILFYLVRAKNGCGGTLGTNSAGVPTTGSSCQLGNGGSCHYDNECIGGGCCSGICSALATDPDHCGGCANVCSSAHMASRTCSSGVCGGSCAASFSNCDGDLLANGCECAGNLCCGNTCMPPHINGLGQSFNDCAPLGVPGNQATYTLTMATEARAAWPFAGSDSSGTCGTGPNAAAALLRQTPTSCAVWVYQKTLAGYVHLNRRTTPAPARPSRILPGNERTASLGQKGPEVQ